MFQPVTNTWGKVENELATCACYNCSISRPGAVVM